MLNQDDIASANHSFSLRQRVGFLVLLYSRMLPELSRFYSDIGDSTSVFEYALRQYENFLRSSEIMVDWNALKEEIWNAIPDSEIHGEMLASLAMNAGLVCANISAILSVNSPEIVLESIGYANDFIDAYLCSLSPERGISTDNKFVDSHPLFLREAKVRQSDIALLKTLPSNPWGTTEFNIIQSRIQMNGPMILRG